MKKKILSFLIPILCLLLMLITSGIIFGNKTIFYGDSQYQYYQSLIYLKDALLGNHSLLYSFQIGFSHPTLSTLCYYLLSPFNLLIVLFKNVEFFCIVSILLRVGLCGLAAYLYLDYQNKHKSTLIFSTAYALSYYIIANYYQVMWLDAYFLAPLILLGIDKLIKEKKAILYIVTLFIVILTNYYMGYMCALFSVLYFIYKYFKNDIKDKKIIKSFIIISILSGLITMFIHIPNLLQIMSITRNNFRNHFFNLHIFDILSNLSLGYTGAESKFNEYTPYIYTGILNFALLIFYFVNKNINKKEKILSGIFILILVLSVIIVPLNNFWHALSCPIGFNFRYMYLFNIFIISLCYKSYINVKQVELKWYYIVYLLFILINFVSVRNAFFPYINIILMLFYLMMLRSDNKDLNKLLIILVVAELFFSGYLFFRNHDLTFRYYVNGVYEEKKNSLNVIDDDSFYRVEFNQRFAFNDAMHYDYYGVTGWLSSVDIKEDYYNKIGYYGYNNMGYYNESIILDSLFGIKYYVSKYDIPYYNKIGETKISSFPNMLYGISYEDSYVYQNPYALSLGYMVNNKAKKGFESDKILDNTECTGYLCQTIMLNNMIGYDNDAYELSDVLEVTSDKDFYLVLVDEAPINQLKTVSINGSSYALYSPSNRAIFNKNNYKIGDKIEISSSDPFTSYIAYINYDKFIENIEQLKNNQLEIEIFEEDYIKGNITVGDNDVLFLSIPYNKDLIIKVDGEKHEYYKLFDYFIGLDLNQGNHTIEIEYKVKGLIPGICISIVSLLGLIVYVKKGKYY